MEETIVKTKVELEEIVPSNAGICGYKVKTNGMTYYYIFPYATGDCQTYTIANIAHMIVYYSDWKDILKTIQTRINKNQLLINVRSDQKGYNEIKEFFGTDIVIEQKYTSTRDSQMCMFLIRTNKLKE